MVCYIVTLLHIDEYRIFTLFFLTLYLYVSFFHDYKCSIYYINYQTAFETVLIFDIEWESIIIALLFRENTQKKK